MMIIINDEKKSIYIYIYIKYSLAYTMKIVKKREVMLNERNREVQSTVNFENVKFFLRLCKFYLFSKLLEK